MGALWRGGNVCRQLISLCILPRLSMVELAGRVAEAALKILTHYGDLEKNFKFLKEVKILSKFFRINWHAQCQFMSAEATRPVSSAYLADCAMPRLIDASTPRQAQGQDDTSSGLLLFFSLYSSTTLPSHGFTPEK